MRVRRKLREQVANLVNPILAPGIVATKAAPLEAVAGSQLAHRVLMEAYSI